MSAGGHERGEGGDDPAQSIRTRGPEVAVAVLLLGLAGLIITDSLRVGIGWGEDGPRSGYFPFYIGIALLLSAGSVLVGQLLRWARDTEVFAQKSQIGLVISVFVPMVVYVALIFVIGIYIASALLIGYFMIRHGKYKLPLTAAVALGVPLFFFGVFERWFLVPLPKGPLERLIGL